MIGFIPGSGRQSNYDPRYFEQLFKIEDKHFWFKTRNRIIATLISQITQGLIPGYKVLEVGCGTGNVLQVLEQTCIHGKVFGMDLLFEGLQYARKRTSSLLVQCDIIKPAFNTAFNLIGLFDVLEHSSCDIKILCNLHEMLANEGALVITVPAHPSLWSYFDEESHHRRRYTLKELKNKLGYAGYHIEYITEYMTSIFPLIWMKRKMGKFVYRERVVAKEDKHDCAKKELMIKPGINELLVLLLSIETRLIARRCNLPFGASLLAIARKAGV